VETEVISDEEEPMPNHLIGLSAKTPQVITEAIWGLAFLEEEPVLLDSIQILYTTGTEPEAATLFHGGALARLKKDYPGEMRWAVPPFARQGLIDVEDVTTEEQASEAATAIYDRLRQSLAARQPEDVFHVVMAGGRKTMAAYMMTAFQLLARSCDCLWHVALRGKLPLDVYYPRPGDPPEQGRTFALHRVPCLALGLPIVRAGVRLDRPFGEILSEVQRRLIVDEREARLEVDLLRCRATYKGVELRFAEKRTQALALLSLLAHLRQSSTADGWLAAGKGTRLTPEQAFELLRFKEIIDARDHRDRLGALPAEARARELANTYGVSFDPHHPSRGLEDVLSEQAIACGKLASTIDRAADCAEPPLDRFLSRESRVGPGGNGLYRRIDLRPECVSLVLPG
jgi:CRISPR-associated protein (TIGR02584 family)